MSYYNRQSLHRIGMEVLNTVIVDSIMPTSIKTVPKIERLVSLIENEFSGSKVWYTVFMRGSRGYSK